MPFLADATDYERGAQQISNIKEDVVVIGSGNVAFDVARTLIRFQNEKYGKSNVLMMALKNEDQVPADIEEVEEGMQEGIKFNLGFGPQKIDIDEKTGEIIAVVACKCTRLFDENNKFNPEFDFSVKQCVMTKQVYLAIGQMSDLSYIPADILKKINIEKEKIKTNDTGQVVGVPWLFAGGDIVRDMDIINGIADGHVAALGIDKYLSKKK